MSLAALLSTALILLDINQSYSFTCVRNAPSQMMQRHAIIDMQAAQCSSANNRDAMYTQAKIDYSAANEYIHAHYSISQYFPHNDCIEAIHDGRRLQESYHNEREMLKDNGLAIVASPMPTTPINWSERDSIQQYYLPELEKIINRLFPEKIIHLSFWNPMMRGESLEISRHQDQLLHTPTANIASLVHIDTDVGAYEKIQDVLAIIDNNRIQRNDSSVSSSSSACDDVANAIVSEKKRFAILNFWRNIGETPVSRAPLSIYSTRYDGDVAFPDAAPIAEDSKWYMFPDATKDEVIVFYQYDRERNQASDLWHCAIELEENESDDCVHRRESLDIRAFIVFDEEVSSHTDRFSSDRSRPILSLEESGCFCDEQAAKRTQGEGE
mmetsp:Transcript_8194/g.11791  ORF Transcript_8194/g.11791 Transcript_8194/m.11791 type:complete len:383 (-) Transcript_8194:208-1356(-)